tara:strand:- start:2171 stop:2443 length:273 start_codon:yes stop_codon:yes gene_type:complete
MKASNNNKETLKEMHLSDQALGAVMMALQKSLMEQSDIVPVLKGFKLVENADGDLTVTNPPLFKYGHEDLEALEGAGQKTDAPMPREEDF